MTGAVTEEVVVAQPGVSTNPVIPPPGAPAGGQMVQEKYCGPITLVIGFCFLPCICCCPCDDRTVYLVNGVKYNLMGAVLK